jgi:two-component system chemotaxis response regulator CheB
MTLRLSNRSNKARHRYGLVVMAASAGGVEALGKVIRALPPDFPLPIAIVQHRTVERRESALARVLGLHAALKVAFAKENEVMQPGTVYIAPAHLHMKVRADRSLAFVDGHKIRHVRSSANPLFESAAEALPGRVIGVVLTGYDRDGTDGVQAVKKSGGIVIAQDEVSSRVFDMPHSAILTGSVDQVLPLDKIATELVRLGHLAA